MPLLHHRLHDLSQSRDVVGLDTLPDSNHRSVRCLCMQQYPSIAGLEFSENVSFQTVFDQLQAGSRYATASTRLRYESHILDYPLTRMTSDSVSLSFPRATHKALRLCSTGAEPTSASK